jgi:hypothetical protein
MFEIVGEVNAKLKVSILGMLNLMIITQGTRKSSKLKTKAPKTTTRLFNVGHTSRLRGGLHCGPRAMTMKF